MWFKLFAVLWLCSLKNVYSSIAELTNNWSTYIPPEDEVSFHLYHHSNLDKGDQIFVGDKHSLDSSRFDPYKDTKIIVHGWTHHKDVPWLVEMREVMADVRNWNVIVVDWAPLSHVVYVEARIHTPVVSKQLANLLLFLNKYKSIPMSAIHCIGHSMGGQICAFAGYKVKQQIGERLQRITGLDPAAPLYEWPHREYLDEVLDPTDAEFVDVIHTNGRHLGMILQAGHVDYYPNGGENQPDCISWICSHLRACELWTASIRNPDLFQAYLYEFDYNSEKADDLAYPMGILSGPQIPRGTYVLETGEEVYKYIHSVTTVIDSKFF